MIVFRPEILARLRQHFQQDESIAIFDASEAPPPVHVIEATAGMLLLVERTFAEDPAGMDFLERFREASPTTEIRVFTEAVGGLPTALEQPPTHPSHIGLRAASQPLRHTPGRRARRVNMPPETTAIVNGVMVRLVNISEHGAQVLSPEILKPGEHVHARLPDTPRRRAVVVWSMFEMLRETQRPGYRAGLAFG
jgi:hypothetical protein